MSVITVTCAECGATVTKRQTVSVEGRRVCRSHADVEAIRQAVVKHNAEATAEAVTKAEAQSQFVNPTVNAVQAENIAIVNYEYVLMCLDALGKGLDGADFVAHVDRLEAKFASRIKGNMPIFIHPVFDETMHLAKNGLAGECYRDCLANGIEAGARWIYRLNVESRTIS